MHTSTFAEIEKKQLVSDWVICWAHTFDSYGETLSGPHALLTLRLDKVLNTPKSLKHILLR